MSDYTDIHIFTDASHRIAYSTDASCYKQMPIGVAYPRNDDDIRALMAEARRRKTHLIPRAGGTSIAGQVVGDGIVVDISRYMNRILEINAEERWVRVQPGVIRDDLNAALKPYGLFFSPETSTSNRCCIGGMVGNNSCGTHSLIYGSTRHHVLHIKAILTDGSYLGDDTPLNHAIQEQLDTWRKDQSIETLITEDFPIHSLRRRSCGYALDECLYGIDGDNKHKTLPDIEALLTGSEGTLAFITEITLSLDPLPPAYKALVCVPLKHIHDAWAANLTALQHRPTAVELIDGRILELAKDNITARRNMSALNIDVNHIPAALLVSEFQGDTEEDIAAQADRYKQAVHESDIEIYGNITDITGTDVNRVWDLRKAGLGVLTSNEGDSKPVGVIEDTAVAPERLGAYMSDFEDMLKKMRLTCVYYGHISTGELHLRPILNLKNKEDRVLFRRIAEETAILVKKHRGSLSGEHGDGRLRGEFIPLMYGQQVYEMFRSLKRTWDPDGILNIGKITDTPPMDQGLRYDINQEYAGMSKELAVKIERCNGSGDCRKSNISAGTMCPTYRVSGDELWSTRARANILREKLTHDKDAILSKEVSDVIESCIACKGCHSECPSNVDMTRIRSELLQTKYEKTGVPFRTWMIVHSALFERIGSIAPYLYNLFATNKLTSYLLKRILHFSVNRNIPTLSRHTLRQLARRSQTNSNATRRIYLFADEFTNYQEAEIGLRFIGLAQALGYEVIIPRHIESGRAAISKGCLKIAAGYAERNVELLADIVTEETPLVGIEPSCILSFRDEYPDLVPVEQRAKARELGKHCMLYDEWLTGEIAKGHIAKDIFSPITIQSGEIVATDNIAETDIWLHGHCHQKALVGIEKTAECLKLIPNANVHVIPSGCCGMAGSYGYEAEHYDTSMAIGEMVLFPNIRTAKKQNNSSIIAAPGTSCRQQIADGTGVKAYHPIELLIVKNLC